MSHKDADALSALQNTTPKSPNAPANVAEREAAAHAETIRITRERQARREAVIRGDGE